MIARFRPVSKQDELMKAESEKDLKKQKSYLITAYDCNIMELFSNNSSNKMNSLQDHLYLHKINNSLQHIFAKWII